MKQPVLLDTGPLVAFINPRDNFHAWAKEQWSDIHVPLLTCEAVITEVCFLLRNVPQGEDAVMRLLESRIVQICFQLDSEAVTIRQLLSRYQSVPMSLADACLVRMSELYDNSLLLTLDSDFIIYRKNQNQTIDVSLPPR
jgi:uncharacterized protein